MTGHLGAPDAPIAAMTGRARSDADRPCKALSWRLVDASQRVPPASGAYRPM